VEGLTARDAQGLDVLAPRLQWRAGVNSANAPATTASPRGVAQTAYQVQVYDNDALGTTPLWDTGVVVSTSTSVLYGGGLLHQAGSFR
jgi:hypothetical protein